jgi:hypothetical protein
VLVALRTRRGVRGFLQYDLIRRAADIVSRVAKNREMMAGGVARHPGLAHVVTGT